MVSCFTRESIFVAISLTHQVETPSKSCQFPHPGIPRVSIAQRTSVVCIWLFIYLVKLVGLAFESLERLFVVLRIIASHGVHLLLQKPETQQFCSAKDEACG